jgi:hypothetical protein
MRSPLEDSGGRVVPVRFGWNILGIDKTTQACRALQKTRKRITEGGANEARNHSNSGEYEER